MNKKIPALIIALGLLYFAYMSRSLLIQLVWDFTSIYSNSKEHPFPLGEGKKISLSTPVNLIRKPYGLTLKTEFLNIPKDAHLHEIEKINYPIHIRLKVYKKGILSKEKILLSEKDFKSFGDFKYFKWENASADLPPATVRYLSFSQWPPGRVFYEIEDLTPVSPIHKEIKTSVRVFISYRSR